MTALWLIATGVGAGVVGAMLGIGGGVLLVPVLALGFKLPLEQAVPVSLMCVVASSCGSAASYVEHRISDVRLALSLEVATVSGAIAGGLVAGMLAPSLVAVAFGLFALTVALQVWGRRTPEPERIEPYQPVNYPLGLGGSFLAGGVSAVLGVGGGPLKVPLMAFGMRVPFKVASATSNLMIGVTGAASVAAYAWRGSITPELLGYAAPVIVGVLGGAMVGTRVMLRIPTLLLKRVFAAVLVFVGTEMLMRGGRALWPAL